MIPEPHGSRAMAVQGTGKKTKDGRLVWPILRGLMLIVASCALVMFLWGFLYEKNWETVLALALSALSAYGLIAMTHKAETPRATVAVRSTKKKTMQDRLPHWSLIAYGFIMGAGFNWACVFLWFSRRYAFFSFQVVGVTGLAFVLYAAIGVLIGLLTRGNWRRALLVFALAPLGVGCIFLRLGL